MSNMKNTVVCYLRYRVLARAIRLGYNVMSIDSDMTVFDDPYKYFKAPPFKDFVVLNQVGEHGCCSKVLQKYGIEVLISLVALAQLLLFMQFPSTEPGVPCAWQKHCCIRAET
jgi:Nucleotide-diphospho-sugar transferase